MAKSWEGEAPGIVMFAGWEKLVAVGSCAVLKTPRFGLLLGLVSSNGKVCGCGFSFAMMNLHEVEDSNY